MRSLRTGPLRKTAASTLRAWADQLEPRVVARRRPAAAPLVRLGGRWWSRGELAGERGSGEV